MQLAASGKWRGAWSSGSSLAVHGAMLLSLVAGSYLRLEPLAERSRPVLFVGGDRPAGPLSAAGSASGARAEVQRNAALTRAREPVQRPLSEMMEAAPAQTTAPETSRSVDILDRAGNGGPTGEGVPDGSPDGIPGGSGGGDGFGGIDGLGRSGVGMPGNPLSGLDEIDQPIYLDSGVRRPVRTTFVKPVYPEMARRVRAEGTVILEVVIGRTGEVEQVKVLRSDPLFDAAAVEAVRQWKYQPALQSARPVSVYLTVKVDFELR